MRRLLIVMAAVLTLAGCAGERIYAPDEAVAAARFVDAGPPTVTLFTVLAKRDGSGAHSGLMISGSERVLFDPAGSWTHPRAPERNDVFFGMTPRLVDFYIDYHARETFDIVVQTVPVSQATANALIASALANGASPPAHCTIANSAVLRSAPEFAGLPATWFPNKLSEAFARLPGATYQKITDTDAHQNHGVLMVQAAATADP
jgi:hypothetical protein